MSFAKGVVLSGPGRKPRFMSNPRVMRPPVRREIKNVKRSIRKMQNAQELKHKDVSIGGGTAAGTLTLLNPLVQGLTEITRIGDEVKATSIQARILFTANNVVTNVGTASGVGRIIIFWDRQSNGAAPTVADLLDLTVATTPYLAPYNDDYQKRFKILFDKTITINPQTTNGTTVSQNTKKFIKFKRRLGRVVKYDGNAGTVADIETNSLYALSIVDDDTDAPQWSGFTRFIYKDV